MTWPPFACVYDWHDPCTMVLQGARLAASRLRRRPCLCLLDCLLYSDSSELRNDVLITGSTSIHADRQSSNQNVVPRSKLRVS